MKILMPIGDGTEALDTFYAYYRLPEDNYEVVVAGPEARLYHTVLHEIPPNPEVTIDTSELSPEEAAQEILRFLERQGFVGPVTL